MGFRTTDPKNEIILTEDVSDSLMQMSISRQRDDTEDIVFVTLYGSHKGAYIQVDFDPMSVEEAKVLHQQLGDMING